MGFDRTDDAEDAVPAAGRPDRAVFGLERGERDGQAAAGMERERDARGDGPRIPGKAPEPGPAAAERVAAHLQARVTADAVYAQWGDRTGSRLREVAVPEQVASADGGRRRHDEEDASRERSGELSMAGRGTSARSPDAPPSEEAALRRRVSELEAGKAASDRRLAGYEARLAEQDKTIAEQGRHMERLEAELGRVAEALGDLREQPREPQASAELGERFRGKEAERPQWQKEERTRRLPADAVNNAVSVALGSAITALPYQVASFPPEVAGISAGALAFGAGIIAVVRERRKARDDEGHRPEN